ncbi:MAG TPA: hypothetical protein VHX15_12100 [Frankiaceae bacterium]|jgi:hypothetical protein|nr:hypothetical protein [Frankiaceae bacterium]
MRLIRSILIRARHWATLQYHLACAREDVRMLGLRVPAGLWVCERCGLVMWDAAGFAEHAHLHPEPKAVPPRGAARNASAADAEGGDRG